MAKIRVGNNKQNSLLKWVAHVKRLFKKYTSSQQKSLGKYCNEGLGKETYEN
jgi:hypothetical protein